jgi:hypothetical protein
MKRHALLSVAIGALMSAVAVAQATPPQTTPPPQTPPAQAAPVMQEMTVVGCIVKGTRPNTYLIDRAVDPSKKDDKPRTYRIQAQMEDPDFETHVNAKVEFKGSAEVKRVPTPPTSGKIDEKELPVFSVKSFQRLADTCTAG